jgi:hypothetical protein
MNTMSSFVWFLLDPDGGRLPGQVQLSRIVSFDCCGHAVLAVPIGCCGHAVLSVDSVPSVRILLRGFPRAEHVSMDVAAGERERGKTTAKTNPTCALGDDVLDCLCTSSTWVTTLFLYAHNLVAPWRWITWKSRFYRNSQVVGGSKARRKWACTGWLHGPIKEAGLLALSTVLARSKQEYSEEANHFPLVPYCLLCIGEQRLWRS